MSYVSCDPKHNFKSIFKNNGYFVSTPCSSNTATYRRCCRILDILFCPMTPSKKVPYSWDMDTYLFYYYLCHYVPKGHALSFDLKHFLEDTTIEHTYIDRLFAYVVALDSPKDTGPMDAVRHERLGRMIRQLKGRKAPIATCLSGLEVLGKFDGCLEKCGNSNINGSTNIKNKNSININGPINIILGSFNKYIFSKKNKKFFESVLWQYNNTKVFN